MKRTVGDRVRVALAGGSRTGLALVLAFAATGGLVLALGLSPRLIVFAVVLAVQLGRRLPSGPLRERAVGLVALPLVAVATALLGELMLHERPLGDALVVLLIFGSLALRDGPPWLARSARLLSLPAVVLFVAPAPVHAGGGSVAWYAVLSLVAGLCVVAADRLLARVLPSTGPDRSPAERRRSRLRPSPSLRVGSHVAIGLTLAFALGPVLFPGRYGWMVVSVLAVSGGLRSRGDVLMRGGERLVGALAGTAVATVASAALGADRAAAIAAIVVLLVVGSLLREVTYVAWAFCVTSVLGLLYGLYGEQGTHLLGERLAENALGALLVIVPSCLLLPIPTSLVVRRRVAALRATLDGPDEVRAQARLALDDAVRPLELLARVTRRRPEALVLADAVRAAQAAHGPAGPSTDDSQRSVAP